MQKHIVHFISNLKDGGAQTQVILLCNNINLNNYKLTIVCWNKTSAIKLNNNINIIELKRGNIFNVFNTFLEIYRLTKKLKPDIMHLWLPEAITLPAALSGVLLNIPIINSERRLPSTKLSKLYFRDRSEYIIHLFSKVVTTNFPIPIKRKSVFNTLLAKKGATIYNGLADIIPEEVNKETDYNRTKVFKLIYCGRLVIQKNVDILIKAIAILVSKNYNIVLEIYGTGQLETSLIELTNSLQLQKNILFLGYKDNWKSLTSQANCFILPTSREGMPNVLFEAAGKGLPIISTHIEEISCHFTDGFDALLVPPLDLNAMVNVLKYAIDNPDLLKILRLNAIETVKKYSVASMSNKYENLYKTVLNLH